MILQCSAPSAGAHTGTGRGSMKVDKIHKAEWAAQEFQKRVNELLKFGNIQDKLFGSKESASVRRSSLELTRALAEMRKP